MTIPPVPGPAVGKELIEFTGLRGIDPGEHVGKICDRTDVVASAGEDKGPEGTVLAGIVARVATDWSLGQ